MLNQLNITEKENNEIKEILGVAQSLPAAPFHMIDEYFWLQAGLTDEYNCFDDERSY